VFTCQKQAGFKSVVPKNKIYAHANLSKRAREVFMSGVGKNLWKYKLFPACHAGIDSAGKGSLCKNQKISSCTLPGLSIHAQQESIWLWDKG